MMSSERQIELENEFLEERILELKSVLTLIAQPPRSDGSYNRDRKACQILAQKALDELNIE
jgi:hypothetical protein